MKSAIVTGAYGFIGSHLVEALKAQGTYVYKIGKKDDLWDIGPNDKYDYIFHLADIQGDRVWARKNCADQFLGNLEITTNVLRYWREYQPDAKFIGFDSLWAYPSRAISASESTYWDGPMDADVAHYGIIKKTLGVGIQAMKRQLNFKGCMLTLGNVYGPGDKSTRLIPSLIHRMLENREHMTIYGNPLQVRDFIFVQDQVRGIIKTAQIFDDERLNIGSGKCVNMVELVDTVAKVMNYKGIIKFEMGTAGGDTRELLTWEATRYNWPDDHMLSLEEGISKSIEWYLKQWQKKR